MLNYESIHHRDTKDNEDRKKGEKKKKQKQKRESEKIRSSNGNLGTNAVTFAKTVREPVLANNPNKAKELLRTQL